MKILTSMITIFAELIVLILAIIWYMNSKEIEPLCIGVAALAAIISSVLLKFVSSGQETGSLTVEDIDSNMGKVGLTTKGKLGDDKISIKKVKGERGVMIEIKDE